MATTRLIPMHQNKGKSISVCLQERTAYAKNPEKTNEGELVTVYQCFAETVDADFMLIKKEYEFQTGRTQGSNVIAYQIRQSFKPGEVTPEIANEIGYQLAMKFTKGNYAFIVATHTDKSHVHNHIIFNSTSIDAQEKFKNFLGSSFAIRKISDRICLEHHLSVIEKPKDAQGHYGRWLGDEKPKSQRGDLENSIGFVLSKHPKTLEDFLQRMEREGYEVKRGKHLAFRRPGQARFIRLRSLQEGYTQEDIIAKIQGKEPVQIPQTTAQKANEAPTKTVTLLIDIQAKLQQGKGHGYEQWAKVFNLKQMSQTLNYLSDNNLLHYDTLAEQTEMITNHFEGIRSEIQGVEGRMAEVTKLQKQIIRYHKTREIFATYKQGGYSKKYLEQHREEIEIHKEAKAFFDQRGLKKLPSVKSLKLEYDELAAQKKSLYSTYQQAKKEMQTITIAKANVDRLLEKEPQEKPKQKQQRER